jgi:class 3 adenylate cyclase
VLFCDLAGYTARGEGLDPEALRRLQTRYFEEARAALESHGATVEKFIGDAVMAVFGIPQVHEDDALRSLRAALDLRRAVQALDLQARIGVNTGEVVAGAGDALVTGDAVNVAARLEQAAPVGEILLGEPTFGLTREAVDVEAVEPLVVKGKVEAVPAYRLLRVREGASAFRRRLDSPLIGREVELARLRSCLEKAIGERRGQLATVVGSPGVGKSRLAREFTEGVGDVTVFSGRCVPYGEGITYWPLVEIFREAGADEELASALSAGATEEISWSVRKSFERRARERPLALVLDDVHWAEPTLLDLIEHLVDWTRDAPVLLLCLARPELLDARPAWDGGRANAETINLEPLTAHEADELIGLLQSQPGSRLGPEARGRIQEAAGGNPLFVEQLVAMLAEGGALEHVPPTIGALLSARIDGLPEDERELIEHASVVGVEFEWEALGELDPNRLRPAGALFSALVRKELIVPHEATEDAFRFRHILIRDAAYERIPKGRRAELHERFASYYDGQEGVADRDELVGYHLEQAYRYRAELEGPDAEGRELAARAADHLGRAGVRALGRSDISAATGLLGRACALLPEGQDERLRLLPELGSALADAGRFDEARSVLAEARRGGDGTVAGRARIEQLFLGVNEPDGIDQAEAGVRELMPLFEELGDDQALARLWRLAGQVALYRTRYADLAVAMERALAHARRAGDEREQGLALVRIPAAVVFGPTPAEEGIHLCEALLEDAAGSTTAEAGVRNGLGMLYAMIRRTDAARAAMRASAEMWHALGHQVRFGATKVNEAIAELYLGDAPAAEGACREGIEVLEGLGERGFRSTAEAVLAQALNLQARYAEAEQASRLSEDLASLDDMRSQLGWRTERARALAHRGGLAEAERLVREAIALAEPTDALDSKAECARALAEILRLAGRDAEAAEAAADALETWERKGIVGHAERARALLAELG